MRLLLLDPYAHLKVVAAVEERERERLHPLHYMESAGGSAKAGARVVCNRGRAEQIPSSHRGKQSLCPGLKLHVHVGSGVSSVAITILLISYSLCRGGRTQNTDLCNAKQHTRGKANVPHTSFSGRNVVPLLTLRRPSSRRVPS